jgi:uncharacterized protein YecE (DUF72 family)
MIKVGTSGFSFPDWVGPIYPVTLKKEEMLPFYERELGFKITEINFTYYSIASPKSFEAMIRKTSPDFEFTVKAHKSMTHEIKDRRTGEFFDNRESFEKFYSSLEPLVDEGRLTAVLAQFPYSFYAKKENYDYILTFKERSKNIPLVVEFRNLYWHSERSVDFLKKNGISYCVVDEPKLKGLMPYHPTATTELAYFRFHGRNRNWFDAPTSERYDYLYSSQELQGFAADIRKVNASSRDTLVMYNNCHAGQAVQNAIETIKILNE